MGSDSLIVAPGGTLDLQFRAVDVGGAPVAGAALEWTAEGTDAAVVAGDSVTGADGGFVLTWRPGTRADEPHYLNLTLRTERASGSTRLTATLRPEVISILRLREDSVSTRLYDPALVHAEAVDPYGNPFVPDSVRFQSADTSIVLVDSSGMVRGVRRGMTWIRTEAGGQRDSIPVHIFQIPADIAVPDTVRLHSLGQQVLLRFTVLSDSGRPVLDTLPDVSVGDSSVILAGAVSDSAVTVTSVVNGVTQLELTVGSVSRNVVVVVAQLSRRLEVTPAGPLQFDALEDTIPLAVAAFDSLDVPLASPSLSFAVSTGAVTVSPGGLVVSRSNGAATIRVAEAGGALDSVAAVVSQVPESLEAALLDTLPILRTALDQPLPLACRAVDRHGFPLPGSPAASAVQGHAQGTSCADLRARSSGYDTIVVQSGALERRLPLVMALRPGVVDPVGTPVILDSVPAGLAVWAPSMLRDAQGRLAIYFAGYAHDGASPPRPRGNLHRLVSTDNGATFQYDGVAFTRDTVPCSPLGDGIENVAIVPQPGGSGWRMFLSAGGFTCYGWQVFSAVSPDQQNWTLEPGVRLGNGAPLPPAPPQFPPWPAGEGMVVDQAPNGDWRMLAGTYEPLTPREDRFQITEWRSPDQIQWSYQGARLTTTQVGAEAERSVYSPTIVTLAPGLFRMIFTGDNLSAPGGHSRLYSAVSLDRVNWQVEGRLMESTTYDFFYAAVVDDLLLTLRREPGKSDRLVQTRLIMP